MMQTKREQWADHVAAWQSSGCSQAQWCREQGLTLASFGYWRRKLRVETAACAVADSLGLAFAGTGTGDRYPVGSRHQPVGTRGRFGLAG